ncbi:hypothetical protein [Neolewinella xylanilytica]|uniref:hypothetical protein n=1 Tax=Neolewinella xylanilytica TaxID=1514080 RepID=UPI000CEABBD7|nr:hypothetical protein [Neolewinella xylanilytica]
MKAFTFSDLVVFPVPRIHAKHNGWKMSLYTLLTLFVSVVDATGALYYGSSLAGILPEGAGEAIGITDQ